MRTLFTHSVSICSLLTFHFSIIHCLAQYCPTNTITTDPNNYQNSSDASATLRWDWMQTTFTGYRPGVPGPQPYQITSPFFNTTGNANLLGLSLPATKNYLPQDGWEFVAKNFGTPTEGTDHPWFMLYNRYTGTLRIFMQINSTTSTFQSALLHVQPTSAPRIYTNAVLNLSGANAIELKRLQGNMTRTIANKYSNSGQGSGFSPYWLYGDIQTMYDPCVCRYNSTLNIVAELFSNWTLNVDIKGQLNTAIVLQQQGNTTVNTSGPLSGISKSLNGSINFLQDIGKFMEAGNALEQYGERFALGLNLSGYNLFTASQNGDFNIERLLKTFGTTIGSLNGMFNVVSTISSLFQKRTAQTAPPIIRTTGFAETKLNATANGNIQTFGNFGNGFVLTPGATASTANSSSHIRPAYNNPLGVFNILKKPKLEYMKFKPITLATYLAYASTQECIDYPSDCPAQPTSSQYIIYVKSTEPLRYLFNPASNLRIKSITASIVFDMGMGNLPFALGNYLPTSPAACDASFGNRSFAFRQLDEKALNHAGFNIVLGENNQGLNNATISTQFLPASCFEKMGFMLSSSGGSIPKLTLKVNLVLEPISNIPGANVEHIVQTYSFDYDMADITQMEEIVPQNGEWLYDDGLNVVQEHSNEFGYWQLLCAYPQIVSNEQATFFAPNADVPKWQLAQTFSGFASHIWLANETVNSDLMSLGNIIIGKDVFFTSNPITIRYAGDIINKFNTVIPANVTLIQGFPDGCATTTIAPENPTAFCTSSAYEDLVKPLKAITLPFDSGATKNGIGAEKINNLALAPNPVLSIGFLTWEQSSNLQVKIDLISPNGQVVKTMHSGLTLAGKRKLTMNFAGLPPGVYTLKCFFGTTNKAIRVIHL